MDFYLPEQHQLIQVAKDLNQSTTRERETRALVDSMHSLPQVKGLLLNETKLPDAKVNEFTVEIRSVAEWSLEESQEK